MFNKVFSGIAAAVLFVGCASAKPAAPLCPTPPMASANVIVPFGDDPAFVIRFEQRDASRWNEARNVPNKDGGTSLLRLTDRETGGRIDFFVIRMPSAAASVAALKKAANALKARGAGVMAREDEPPFPERNAFSFSMRNAVGGGIDGEVEVHGFPPRPWAVLAIGAWPSSAARTLVPEFEAMMESVHLLPTGPLGPKAALAQCLADKGVKLYSAWWCGPCEWQKKQFGEAVSRLPVVECYPEGERDEIRECRDAKLKSLPTWVFPDGMRVDESMTLADLAKRSGCPAPPVAP